MQRKIILIIVAVFSLACGALNNARPLDKGQHRVGATFGGPVLTQLGPPIPVPNLIIEGKSGLSPLRGKPLDVNYGLNSTALAFGTIGVHAGVSQLMLEQKGWIPSVAVTERVHLYNNFLDTTKPKETRKAYLLNQIDLTLGWDVQRHIAYAGLANYIDVADPELNIAPFAGFQYQSKGRFFGQVEARYLAANRQPDIVDVSFLGGNRGALSTTFSMGWTFGGQQ